MCWAMGVWRKPGGPVGPVLGCVIASARALRVFTAAWSCSFGWALLGLGRTVRAAAGVCGCAFGAAALGAVEGVTGLADSAGRSGASERSWVAWVFSGGSGSVRRGWRWRLLERCLRDWRWSLAERRLERLRWRRRWRPRWRDVLRRFLVLPCLGGPWPLPSGPRPWRVPCPACRWLASWPRSSAASVPGWRCTGSCPRPGHHSRRLALEPSGWPGLGSPYSGVSVCTGVARVTGHLAPVFDAARAAGARFGPSVWPVAAAGARQRQSR